MVGKTLQGTEPRKGRAVAAKQAFGLSGIDETRGVAEVTLWRGAEAWERIPRQS
jgi:hypothetical protein